MQIDEIRMNLSTIKSYMKCMEDWIRQTKTMVYDIEDKILDLHEKDSYEFFEETNSILFSKKN